MVKKPNISRFMCDTNSRFYSFNVKNLTVHNLAEISQVKQN